MTGPKPLRNNDSGAAETPVLRLRPDAWSPPPVGQSSQSGQSGQSGRVRCLVSAADDIVRAGLTSIVSAQHDLCVVGEAADAGQLVELVVQLRPHVALIDAGVLGPDPAGAVRLVIHGLDGGSTGTVAVVLTSQPTETADELLALACLQAGARAYVSRTGAPGALVPAIRAAHLGHTVLDGRLVASLTERALAPRSVVAGSIDDRLVNAAVRSLSPRERDVLAALTQGHSNRQVASSLGLREATVKTHVSRLLAKLGVQSRTEAVVLAHRAGIVAGDRAV